MGGRRQSPIVVLLLAACSAPEPQRPPVRAPVPVVITTPDLPSEKPTSKLPPPPPTSRPSDASLFAAGEPEPRGRKRRKRRKRQPATTLVETAPKSEDNVTLDTRDLVKTEADAIDDATLAVLRANRQAIVLCSADARRRGERATGKMEIEVVVDGSGWVRSTRLLSDAHAGTILGSCVLRRLKEWRFPERGERTTMVLPFVVEAD